jgi:hypothetical protein
MSYAKFDDSSKKTSQSARKINEATWEEDMRRALQGVLNRVLWGTGGTSGTSVGVVLGTGSTCGIKLPYPMILLINGRIGTAAAQDNIYLPSGTQTAATYVKYLVSVGFGTKGTVTAGNEGTGSTTALLPDCPDGMVAIGYVEYAANGTRGYIRIGGGTAGNSQNVLSGNAGGTCGTVNAWVDLVHMPLGEA